MDLLAALTFPYSDNSPHACSPGICFSMIQRPCCHFGCGKWGVTDGNRAWGGLSAVFRSLPRLVPGRGQDFVGSPPGPLPSPPCPGPTMSCLSSSWELSSWEEHRRLSRQVARSPWSQSAGWLPATYNAQHRALMSAVHGHKVVTVTFITAKTDVGMQFA